MLTNNIFTGVQGVHYYSVNFGAMGIEIPKHRQLMSLQMQFISAKEN